MRTPRCLVLAIFAVAPVAQATPQLPSTTTISVVGTSDLHGHIAALPWFAGYLENLRAKRAATGGAVVVLDAGDMFQGTLESNLEEGAPVVRAYNTLGYSAVAIGNHEFDFGPAGPAPSPVGPHDDPQGALKARAAQARFPFLAANVIDKATGRPVAWPNFHPSTLITVAGIKVGIVGVVTAATPHSALPANVAGLDFLPLAKTIAREARLLRARGASVVLAVAHEGGECHDFADPDKLDSCDVASTIFSIVRSLPRGSVDAVVAGHTHQALAQRVASVPIIQSYSNGRAFGRVDLIVERPGDDKGERPRAWRAKVVASHLYQPHDLCPDSTPADCKPTDYEDRAVHADKKVDELNARAFAQARRKGEEDLGVQVVRPLPHSRKRETALGNLLVDLMRAARPGIDVAMLNGGGMRAGLPAGPLSYGRLYETFPFDNAFASLRMSAGEFRKLLARSLSRSPSQVSLSGLRLSARCKGDTLEVALIRPDGAPIEDDQMLTILTTDFLATGGDGFFDGANVDYNIGSPLRDGLAEALLKRGGTLDPEDRLLFDPAHPRFSLPSDVPVKCSR